MKKIYFLVLTFALLAGSCNEFDAEINTNPNQPSVASGPQLLASAMLALPDLSESPQGEFLAQYLAETQYVTTSLYPQASTSFYGWYQGPLINIETVLENSNATPEIMVAKILKAYYFWNITDRWGDVPFTEALKGATNLTPFYDTQEDIYNDLFALLKEANNMEVTGQLSSDIMYGGDMDQWRKLANTIRLLMALRLSEVNPTLGKTEFTAALNDGVMTSNDDNLVFNHLADANNQGYWYGQITVLSREWWALTEGLVNEMKPVNDPRLPVYGNPARESGEYVGQLYGDIVDFDTEKYSLLGDEIARQDSRVHLVTYAQVLFAMAEAAKLEWIPGGDTDAQAYYEEAIEQSFLQWTGSSDGIDDFLAEPAIAYDPDQAIKQIATQRWVHLFMHGYEAWAEWRRTGYPDNLVEPEGAAVPNRLIYVESEQFNNTENYNEAVQRQFGGTESLYGKVWWDAN